MWHTYGLLIYGNYMQQLHIYIYILYTKYYKDPCSAHSSVVMRFHILVANLFNGYPVFKAGDDWTRCKP